MLVLRIGVGERLPAVFSIDEVVNHPRLQWARSKQGNEGDDILKTIGLKPLNKIFHPPGFKLKDGGRLGSFKQLEYTGIIQWDVGDIHGGFPLHTGCIDHRHGPVNDRQSAKTQKVELDQPGFLDIILVVLGHQSAPLLIAVERREIGEFGWSDNYATGVLTDVARDALQLASHIPYFLG